MKPVAYRLRALQPVTPALVKTWQIKNFCATKIMVMWDTLHCVNVKLACYKDEIFDVFLPREIFTYFYDVDLYIIKITPHFVSFT